jgi:hypothetical protein
MGKSYCERRASFLVETTSSDVRYALRSLRKNAAFTITSVAVLALAIGVNTAMFSVLNAVLFRPLPYPSPEQLAMLWSEVPTQGVREGRSAYVSVEEWRRRTRSFAGLAVFDPGSVTMMTASGAEQVSVARVSPNMFPLLGIQPSLGRIFSDREAEGREPLALITHRFWQTRFGGSPGVIGASLELDGHTSQIIGVLPAGFQLADLAADVWEPHTMFADWESRRGVNGPESWFALGRLRQNVSIRQAQQEMSAIARHLNELSPASGRNRGISVVPLSLQLTGPRLRLSCGCWRAPCFAFSLSPQRTWQASRWLAVPHARGSSPFVPRSAPVTGGLSGRCSPRVLLWPSYRAYSV